MRSFTRFHTGVALTFQNIRLALMISSKRTGIKYRSIPTLKVTRHHWLVHLSQLCFWGIWPHGHHAPIYLPSLVLLLLLDDVRMSLDQSRNLAFTFSSFHLHRVIQFSSLLQFGLDFYILSLVEFDRIIFGRKRISYDLINLDVRVFGATKALRLECSLVG